MGKIVQNAETNAIVQGFVDLGWTVEQKKSHVVIRNPADGADRLTISNGAKCAGWEHIKRLKSRLRRAQERQGG